MRNHDELAVMEAGAAGAVAPGRGVGSAARVAALAALGLSGLAAGVIGGLSGLVAYNAARPRPSWGSGEPPEGTARPVSFASSEDGTRLNGWYLPAPHPAPAPALLFCHGAWTGRRECLPLALQFHAAGYSVLCFDFRAHGESAGRYLTVGHHEAHDVLGAVAFLAAQPEVDPDRIGVVGYSMGAAAAIRAAAASPAIAAVVADSPYADFEDAVQYSFRQVVGRCVPRYPFAPLALGWARWLTRVDPRRLRPVEAIGRLAPRPILLIHGQEDEIVPARHAAMLFDAADEPKELWLVPGATHVGARMEDPDAYFRRVSTFLRDALAEPRPDRRGVREVATDARRQAA